MTPPQAIAQSTRPTKTSSATLDITVLAGGIGVEREVSAQSGRLVGEALRRLHHRVKVLDITPDDLSALDHSADVVFIALHGAFGEDGTIQRLCEQRGIFYTGSDAHASRLAMDKVAAKGEFIEQGITTPCFDVVKTARLKRAVQNTVPPVVVKPCDSGSSVDTYIVREPHQLEPALTNVVSRYGAALVERFIEGPELTVGVLGDQALPVCEIRTKREFYDYQAKYIDDDTEYLFDIDLPEDLLQRVQQQSVAAHQALGCRDFSRVDWMIERATLEPHVIEVNTIPGLTSHSLLPKAAARIGLPYDQLCQKIIDMALDRAAGR